MWTAEKDPVGFPRYVVLGGGGGLISAGVPGGWQAGVRLPVIPSPVAGQGPGMMGFAVLGVDGVNQNGATSPVSPPQAGCGGGGVGVMTCTTSRRPVSGS